MPGYLLDTHVVLWAAQDPARLSPAVTRIIVEEAEVFVSAASIWEIAIKQALGKLQVVDDFLDRLRANSFQELPVTWAHGRWVSELPAIHRDPFDRLLAAQAIAEDLVLVTTDRDLVRYPVRTLF